MNGRREAVPRDTPFTVDGVRANDPPATRTIGDLHGAVATFVFLGPGDGPIDPPTLSSLAPLIVAPDDVRGPVGVPAPHVRDPGGRLAAAPGVTSRPATTVLDREGAVALRAGAPSPALVAAVTSLAADPVPPDVAPAPVPAAASFLQGRSPLPAEETPMAVAASDPFAGSRDPRRVWRLGPTADGKEILVGLYLPRLWSRSGDVWSMVNERAPGGTSIARYTTDVDLSGPLFTTVTLSGAGTSRSVFVVAPGYDRLTIAGRSFPVRNGAVSVALPTARASAPAVLTGPAGARLVPAPFPPAPASPGAGAP